MRKLMTYLALIGAIIMLLPVVALAEGAGGVTGPDFYVDGVLYRTVATPTNLPDKAPAHSFDTIYDIAGQPNVATAAPGDSGYNGGRWMVHALEVTDPEAADTNGSGDIDSAAEVEAAIAAGHATDLGVVKLFTCPVIKVPGGGN